LPERMHAGMIASYRLRPLPLTTVTWITEITHVVEPYFFVDEQRFGPYRFWHHQHHFHEAPGGIEMRDLVSYIIPFGVVSAPIAPFVAQRLHEIFEYRRTVLESMIWK